MRLNTKIASNNNESVFVTVSEEGQKSSRRAWGLTSHKRGVRPRKSLLRGKSLKPLLVRPLKVTNKKG